MDQDFVSETEWTLMLNLDSEIGRYKQIEARQTTLGKLVLAHTHMQKRTVIL